MAQLTNTVDPHNVLDVKDIKKFKKTKRENTESYCNGYSIKLDDVVQDEPINGPNDLGFTVNE